MARCLIASTFWIAAVAGKSPPSRKMTRREVRAAVIRKRRVRGFLMATHFVNNPLRSWVFGRHRRPVKVQLSGGAEWQEASVSKQFPRN
jgi:hypothetical protein